MSIRAEEVFTETVLLRECFPVYLLQIFLRTSCGNCFRSNLTITKFLMISEDYSEPCHLSKIKLHTKIGNGSKPLTIFAKNSVLDL